MPLAAKKSERCVARVCFVIAGDPERAYVSPEGGQCFAPQLKRKREKVRHSKAEDGCQWHLAVAYPYGSNRDEMGLQAREASDIKRGAVCSRNGAARLVRSRTG